MSFQVAFTCSEVRDDGEVKTITFKPTNPISQLDGIKNGYMSLAVESKSVNSELFKPLSVYMLTFTQIPQV